MSNNVKIYSQLQHVVNEMPLDTIIHPVHSYLHVREIRIEMIIISPVETAVVQIANTSHTQSHTVTHPNTP